MADSLIRLRQLNKPEVSGYVEEIISGYLTGHADQLNPSTGELTGAFYPLHTNPSGYLTGIPAEYITSAQTGNFLDDSDLTAYTNVILAQTNLLYYPLTGNPAQYIDESQTGLFYPNSNPEGFINQESGDLLYYPLDGNASGIVFIRSGIVYVDKNTQLDHIALPVFGGLQDAINYAQNTGINDLSIYVGHGTFSGFILTGDGIFNTLRLFGESQDSSAIDGIKISGLNSSSGPISNLIIENLFVSNFTGENCLCQLYGVYRNSTIWNLYNTGCQVLLDNLEIGNSTTLYDSSFSADNNCILGPFVTGENCLISVNNSKIVSDSFSSLGIGTDNSKDIKNSFLEINGSGVYRFGEGNPQIIIPNSVNVLDDDSLKYLLNNGDVGIEQTGKNHLSLVYRSGDNIFRKQIITEDDQLASLINDQTFVGSNIFSGLSFQFQTSYGNLIANLGYDVPNGKPFGFFYGTGGSYIDLFNVLGYGVLNNFALTSPVVISDLIYIKDKNSILYKEAISDAINSGNGTGLFIDNIGNDLVFRSIVEGSGITLSTGNGTLIITANVTGDFLPRNETGIFASQDWVNELFYPVTNPSGYMRWSTYDTDNDGQVNDADHADEASLADAATYAIYWGNSPQFGSPGSLGTSGMVLTTLGDGSTAWQYASGNVDAVAGITGITVTGSNGITGLVDFLQAGNITLIKNGNDITISGAGEASSDTASNLGAGEGIFAQKAGSDFQFKSLLAAGLINLSSDSNAITISGSSINHNNTLSIQGGTSNQYYHLTSSEYSNLVTGLVVRPSDTGILDDLFAPISHNHTHNNLDSLQGGTTNEYYHLTQDSYNKVNGLPNAFVTGVQVSAGSPITGLINFAEAGNVDVSIVGNTITISGTTSVSSDSATNLGAGSGIFFTKDAGIFQFKSLVPGANFQITGSDNELFLNVTGAFVFTGSTGIYNEIFAPIVHNHIHNNLTNISGSSEGYHLSLSQYLNIATGTFIRPSETGGFLDSSDTGNFMDKGVYDSNNDGVVNEAALASLATYWGNITHNYLVPGTAGNVGDVLTVVSPGSTTAWTPTGHTHTHNSLTTFQGGTTNEYFHLTSGQWANIVTGTVIRPSDTGQFSWSGHNHTHNNLNSILGSSQGYHLSQTQYNNVVTGTVLRPSDTGVLTSVFSDISHTHNHNDLSSIFGDSAGYHLSQAQYNDVNTGAYVRHSNTGIYNSSFAAASHNHAHNSLTNVSGSSEGYHLSLAQYTNIVTGTVLIPSDTGSFASQSWVNLNYLAKTGGRVDGPFIAYGTAGAGGGFYVYDADGHLHISINDYQSLAAFDEMEVLDGNFTNELTFQNNQVVTGDVVRPSDLATYIDESETGVFADINHNHTHNNLNSLQGGTTNEYYHLTSSEYSNLVTGTVTRPSDTGVLTNVFAAINHNHDETYAPIVHNHDGSYYPLNTNPSGYVTTAQTGHNHTHNSLSSLQGGTAGQYYHLTQAKYTYLTSNTFLTGVTAAGSDEQIQFNNNGVLGGVSKLYWDNETARLGFNAVNPAYSFEFYQDSFALTTTSYGAPLVFDPANTTFSLYDCVSDAYIDVWNRTIYNFRADKKFYIYDTNNNAAVLEFDEDIVSYGGNPIFVIRHPDDASQIDVYNRMITGFDIYGANIHGGTINATSIQENGNNVVVIKSVPANSTSAGTAGDVSYDSSYFYVCTASNTWKRIKWDTGVW